MIQTPLSLMPKSGTSGAGRSAKVDSLFCEVNENIKAYGVASHRHTPEIEEQLSYAAGKPVVISFTPHLVPMNRGILVTAYASLTKEVTWEEVRAAYDKYYKDEYFVRVLDKDVVPQTRCRRKQLCRCKLQDRPKNQPHRYDRAQLTIW